MKNLKVEGHDDLYKNVDTGMIVNRSSSDRDRYRIAKQQALRNLESQNDIENLKNEKTRLQIYGPKGIRPNSELYLRESS